MALASEHSRDVGSKAKIFISYSRKDMAFADRLEVALRARGFEPLIDRQDPIVLQDWSKGIAPFEDWWKRIETLIGKADTIVFVLSPDAVASKVALKEIDYAASLNKRFAPIVCRPVEDSTVPEALRRLNFIFFDDPSRFETSADHLAATLQVDLDWIRKHGEYGEVARRWAAAGRPGARGLLLRPPLLEDAERWIASRPRTAPSPTEEAIAFVAESRRAATSRRRSVTALACADTLVMVMVLVAWWQQNWLSERIYVWRKVNVLTAKQEHALKPKNSFTECTDCPEMVVVPAGSFMMGSPSGQISEWEIPLHGVTIAKAFAVSKYELTFAEWDACVAHADCIQHVSDSGWGRNRQPVINVNWGDAKSYVAWLSRITGKEYRLLSEAEYEYAMRGGQQTIYPWGNAITLNGTAMANCNKCSSQWDGKQTAPVGSFAPNSFGLYDMVGNVLEWVQDCWHRNYEGAPPDGSAWTSGDCSIHVARAGSWGTSLRPANRYWHYSDNRDNNLGFRVARTLAP
jgi:formylglycine-generating enzyme required for sulfatase activity